MLPIVPALIVATLATSNAEAQVPEIAGPGVMSCAEFAAAYRNNPVPTETQFFAWSQGYMSAANVQQRMRNERTRNLRGMANASQKQFLRSFCDQRPLASFAAGVLTLYGSLPENPPRSN